MVESQPRVHTLVNLSTSLFERDWSYNHRRKRSLHSGDLLELDVYVVIDNPH